MSTQNSISGHVRNIANFNKLISICNGIGNTYQPASDMLALAKLQLLYIAADTAKTTLENAMPTYTQAVTVREDAYAPLAKLVTRIVSALAASDAAPGIVTDVKSISRKFTAHRKSKKATAPEDETPEQGDENEYLRAQLSYDSKVSNFASLIALLKAIPDYDPNEEELSTDALTELHTSLKAHNKSVADAYQPVANARINRNSVLYTKTFGLVDTSKKVKAYVKSAKGTGSDTYKQIVALKFSIPKKVDPNLNFRLPQPQ